MASQGFFYKRFRTILKLPKDLGLSCVKSFFKYKVGLRLQGPAHTGSFNWVVVFKSSRYRLLYMKICSSEVDT